MKPVSDPGLLAQLNQSPARLPVSDPRLLAELSGTAPEPRSSQNFFERVGGDINKRADMAAEIQQATKSGLQSKPEEIWQLAGKAGAGLVNDIAGEALTSVGRGISNVIPDFIENPARGAAKDGIHYLGNTAPGRAAVDMAQKAVQGYEGFKDEHPRAARNIEATIGIGSVLGTFAPIKGQSVAGAAASKTGQAARSVGDAGIDVARTLNTKNILPDSQKIRKTASDLYQLAEQKGGTLKPQFVDDFLVRAEKELLSDDAVIRQMKANRPLADTYDDLLLFKNQPMTLQRAQALDEQLGEMIADNTDLGNVNKVGKKLQDVQSTLRDMIEEADESLIEGGTEGFEALKNARSTWAASRRMADVERIIQRAEMMQQPANSIKAGFRTLYNNPKKMRGFSEAERAAIKKAAETGVVGDTLSTLGSRLTSLVGLASGNPMLAGAAHVGSGVSRKAAEQMQLGRANKILETISANSGVPTTKGPRSELLAKALKQPTAEMQNMNAQRYAELLQNYGQSELGRAVAANPDLKLKNTEKMARALAKLGAASSVITHTDK